MAHTMYTMTYVLSYVKLCLFCWVLQEQLEDLVLKFKSHVMAGLRDGAHSDQDIQCFVDI